MRHVNASHLACNLVTAGCLAVAALAAHAQQAFPARPLRIVVPLAPGGTTDIMGRTMAQHLAVPLGQQVIVENRPGAGGTIGSEYVAKSPPDGHTMLIISADTYTINAVLYRNLSFDSRKDLLPLSVLAASPSLLTVHPSLPVKTVRELVALSKARPGELNYGSGGSSGMLRMELLKFNTGLNITNIPYKGSGPALVDQIAGHVHAGFFNLVATAPFVQSGKLRGIVVTGTKRSDRLPQVPSTAEAGVKGFDENAGYLMLAPAATPAHIVNRLNAEIVKVLHTAEVRGRLAAEGSEIVGSTPQQAAATVHALIDQWADLVRRTGIKVQ